MKIEEILSQHKPALLKKWLHLVLRTYPDETATFLKNENDPFANPVGSTIVKGIEDLFEGLIKEGEHKQIPSFLDRIIHIRAVQEFTPSQALSFIFMLKKVIREELKKELKEKELFDELLAFESKIDELALAAFNRYVECREKVFELKANEVKNRYSGLVRRLNRVSDTPNKKLKVNHTKSEAH
ncbi:MAG TPA: RsbRD N-terminal domain-containing protein [Thermodesulfobacteriota bacterium]|nr:RsbRD N-terminal domain-containing protein [Thermodesulfobacteriota bacterium]